MIIGQLDDARGCFETALKLNYNHVDSHYNLGNLFKAQEQYEKAVASYRRTIEIDPNYKTAFNNLGRVFFILNQFSESVISFKKSARNLT